MRCATARTRRTRTWNAPLGWIERVRPRRAILTNLHIDLDYETLKAELPPGVEPAFDGMRFEHELSGNFS